VAFLLPEGPKIYDKFGFARECLAKFGFKFGRTRGPTFLGFMRKPSSLGVIAAVEVALPRKKSFDQVGRYESVSCIR
jgi:hypothetical protein